MKKELNNWLKLMISNGYLIIFTVFLGIVIYQCTIIDQIVYNYYSNPYKPLTIIAVSLPSLICIITGYKGLFQFWKDDKKGKTR